MTVISTWPDCRNVRDVGGLATNDGGQVRAGALIRSDSLCRLTAEGIRAVEGDGVGMIIDLRFPAECAGEPNPFAGRPVYRHISLLTDAFISRVRTETPSVIGGYRITVDDCAGQVARVVTALAQAPAGAAVVHCHAGKDRTGVVVALALAVAGVEPEVIAADYSLSDQYLDDEILAAELAAAPPELREEMAEGQSRAATMIATLEHLETSYGGVVPYLSRAGVTDDDLAALRSRLRE